MQKKIRSLKINLPLEKNLIVSFFLSLSVFIAFYMIFSIAPSCLKKKPLNNPFIHFPYTGKNQYALKEQSLLFDSEPLFIPSECNAISYVQPVHFKNSFLPTYFPPKLQIKKFSNSALTKVSNRLFIRKSSITQNLLEKEKNRIFKELLVLQVKKNPTPTFETKAFPKNKATIFFHQLNGQPASLCSQKEIEIDLPINAKQLLWPSVDFIILVKNYFLLGAPLMVSSSGNEKIDEFFKNYLLKTETISKIKDGYYQVTFTI